MELLLSLVTIGVHRRLNELSLCSIFVHCPCHDLQQASVQSSNATPGIKHVYTILMAYWKFFINPQDVQLLKMIQTGLVLSELKIMKPLDTHWLALELCIIAVKASYSSIVLAFENIYAASHEPEALGLSKAFSSQSTMAALYLLDYIPPQVAKLSLSLQSKHLDLLPLYIV